MNDYQIFFRRLPYRFKRNFLLLLLASCFVLAMEAIFAVFLAKLVGGYLSNSSILEIAGVEIQISFAFIIFMSLLLVKIFFGVVFYKFLYNHVYEVKSNIQQQLFIKSFDVEDEQSLSERVLVTSQHIVGFFYGPLLTLLTESIIVFGMLILLSFFVGFSFFGIFFGVVACVMFAQSFVNSKSRALSQSRIQIEQDLGLSLDEISQSMFEIKYSKFLSSLSYKDVSDRFSLLSSNYANNFFLNNIPRLILEFVVYGIVCAFMLADFSFDNASIIGLVFAVLLRLLASSGKILGSLQNISFSQAALRLYLESVSTNTSGFFEESDVREISQILESKQALIVISGQSGVGKSTFLRNLTRFLHSSGFEFVYVGQSPFIAPQSLVCNIDGGGVFPDQFLVQKLQLESLQARDRLSAASLSGGERARVGLIRALSSTGICLIDEPTSALDKNTASTVRDLICAASESRLVFCVSHDNDLIQRANYSITFDAEGDIHFN